MSGPFNYQAELASLQSKQKLAEAMRQATMTGQLRTGGGLGGLVTALMRPGQLDRMERENLDAQAALQERHRSWAWSSSASRPRGASRLRRRTCRRRRPP